MATTVNVILDVPDLPDADIWFANAAAWKNYWKNIPLQFTFQGATTTKYVPFPYDVTLIPVAVTIEGVNYDMPTMAMFTSLHNRLDTLESKFQDMRTEMKDAGLITQAQ